MESINRRSDGHLFDVLFRLIHSQARFIAFLLADGQSRFIGGTVGANILFQLREGALGLVQSQNVFLRVNLADQLVLADFELRLAHRVLCFQQRRLILGRLHGGVGLSLDNFLFGLFQVAAVLREVVFLLARIKSEHHLALMNG